MRVVRESGVSPLGQPVPHESAIRHVTGEARYVDDLPEPSGLLHGWPIASPVAHGRLRGVDAGPALVVPGVHAVLFAADVPGVNQVGPVFQDEPLFAEGEVHCVGQLIGVVFASSREAARVAAGKVRLDIEELPALLDLDAAIEARSFLGADHHIVRGDVDAALAAAPHRLVGRESCGGQEHFYLETQAALAVPGENDVLHVTSSTQHPSEVQHLVAHALGWGSHRVVVECPRMGGGFGGKETQAAPLAAMAALGAWHTGRPCKVVYDRHTDMGLTGRRHPFQARWEASFDEAGRIAGLAVDLYANAGWASDLSLSILDRGLFHLDNGYWLPNVRLIGRTVRTNHVSNTAFRGFGGPQGMLFMERILDRIANHLGLDPLAVRRANLYTSPEQRTPYGQPVGELRLAPMIDALAASAELEARSAQIEAFNQENTWVKRGIALTPVKFGISFTATFLNQAGALVLAYQDGSIQLSHGGTEMGQGLYTKMLQVAAHALGVPLAAIRHMATSTDKVPNTSATAASSGADLNGQAVRDACVKLVDRLKPVAAGLLGASVDAVSFAVDGGGPGPGWAWVGERAVGFSEVTRAAYLQQVSLAATGFYRTPDIHYDRSKGQGHPFFYFAYGVACAEVEVSGLTGEWRLLRADLLHDVGDSLSPDLDIGQVEGAFIQGMGWLTMEELVWDDRGRTVTRGPSTYKIPAIGDTPLDLRVQLLPRATQPGVIHGSKAVGEPPFMLAISVHSALSRAVSAFGRPELVPAPATPEALLLACEAARGA
jgi:xanthine dehydrogenase large subunit